jgi:hypothetical protein
MKKLFGQQYVNMSKVAEALNVLTKETCGKYWQLTNWHIVIAS